MKIIYHKNGCLKKVFRLLISIFLLVILGCGHKKSPTGGPKDTVKPEILMSDPVKFSDISGKNVSFIFSKQMDQKSIYQGLQIYPKIQAKKYIWDKQTLTVSINEELIPSINYFFYFNNEVECYHGNNLEETVLYTFHTGYLNDKKVSGSFSYEIKTDSEFPVILSVFSADTTFIYKKKFETNYYEIENLTNENCILRSFVDKNLNNKFDLSSEPYKEVVAVGDSTQLINIELAYIDSVKPQIKTIKQNENLEIEIDFTENISSYEGLKVKTTDSLATEITILGEYLNNDKLIILPSKIDSVDYEISFTSLIDLKNNNNQDHTDELKASVIIDTLSPLVVNSKPRDGSVVYSLKPIIQIEFSEIILDNNILVFLESVESSESIDVNIIEGNSRILKFQPEKQLENYTSYIFSIKESSSDSHGNIFKDDFTLRFIPILKEK